MRNIFRRFLSDNFKKQVALKTMKGTKTVVTADYDYIGRRVYKKVETVTPDPEGGDDIRTITLHQRYLYRGYLQIATLDLTRSGLNSLWLITWDPTEPVATRPLALQKDGTWYTCGIDLPKNVTEIFSNTGGIRTAYTYTPYGQITSRGNVTQPIQWSSEYNDAELGMVYYNYRHYNPLDGRWVSRDPIGEAGGFNIMSYRYEGGDALGLIPTNSISGAVEGAVISGDVQTLRNLLDLSLRIGNYKLAKYIATKLKEIENEKKKQKCKPCIPPAGTKLCMKALPCTRIRGAHKNDKTGHVKTWQINQDPDCQCHINFVESLENTLQIPSDCQEIFNYPNPSMVKGGGRL